MRLGIDLPHGQEVAFAKRAEQAGLAMVRIVAEPGTEASIAAAVAAATSWVRIVVTFRLGHENPLTLIEEAHVLDNLSGGRIVALLDARDVDLERGREEVEIIAQASAQRPFTHAGKHWTLPAQLPEHENVPSHVMVTPPPAQLAVPIWVDGVDEAPNEVHVLVRDVAEVGSGRVAPGLLELSGDPNVDHAAVLEFFAAGATHLILSGDSVNEQLIQQLSGRWGPEVSMVDFPHIVTSAKPPLEWQGNATNNKEQA